VWSVLHGIGCEGSRIRCLAITLITSPTLCSGCCLAPPLCFGRRPAPNPHPSAACRPLFEAFFLICINSYSLESVSRIMSCRWPRPPTHIPGRAPHDLSAHTVQVARCLWSRVKLQTTLIRTGSCGVMVRPTSVVKAAPQNCCDSVKYCYGSVGSATCGVC
jgi:hypothetical protein